MSDHLLLPTAFPESWASAWGEDQYGLWMAFEVSGVEQRMRWIPRGTFQMGEKGDHHWVTLTNGFWLAETVCSQQLYKAVTGNNPSEFEGEQRPVEMVSHDQSVSFIEQLNALLPGLECRLPTESEWEYACRAGTTTEYWFGDELTSKQARFNATETVDVKARPCNSWGLYQMHGNVWEWCSDRYGKYPVESVTDPMGPESGTERVLRGGCWDFSAGDLRSAVRGGYPPDYRNLSTGFRLARGQPVEAE